VAVTDTPSTGPVASPPSKGHQTPQTAAPSSVPQASAAPAAPAVDPRPAPAPSPPIGFSLSYDDATHRLVLEAREPGSGFVISQIPPAYAVRLFSASIGPIAPSRGGKVNSAA